VCSMDLLRGLLGTTNPVRLPPVRFQYGACWQLRGVYHPAEFLLACTRFLPASAMLIIEGGDHPPALQAYLASIAISPTAELPSGTSWPRQERIVLPAYEVHLLGMAELVQHCSARELCVHIFAHDDQQVLLEALDAFQPPGLVYLAGTFAREVVSAAATTLRCHFTSFSNPHNNAP
jgi:hypothetical protein